MAGCLAWIVASWERVYYRGVGEFQAEFAASGSGGTTPWTGAAQTCAIFQVHYDPCRHPRSFGMKSLPILPMTYQQTHQQTYLACIVCGSDLTHTRHEFEPD